MKSIRGWAEWEKLKREREKEKMKRLSEKSYRSVEQAYDETVAMNKYYSDMMEFVIEYVAKVHPLVFFEGMKHFQRINDYPDIVLNPPKPHQERRNKN